MIELNGKYNTAKIYTDLLDNETISQIISLCNRHNMEGSKIRIMPDTHAGQDCTIGTTFTITDNIVPNYVSGDIGCGMFVVQFETDNNNITEDQFKKLDNYLKNLVMYNGKYSKLADKLIDKLICKKQISLKYAYDEFATIGNGNHFCEIDRDKNGKLYMVIHSGSRNLGSQVCKYYQKLAYYQCNSHEEEKRKIIDKLKVEGRTQEIQSTLKSLKFEKYSKNISFLTGDALKDYLHDMDITQQYANKNRELIGLELCKIMGFKIIDQWSTIHNYIDTKNMILRKGAISAQKGERLIIPLNMRDGSIIGIGKGNEDWNCSAPHGAGRVLSRSAAKEKVDFEKYKKDMKSIWTTSVNLSTIDEAPDVYKPMEEIINNVKDTIDIVDIIKPIYVFKASDENE